MIVDLFAGHGWDIGARQAGLPDPIGLELDPDTCATRAIHRMPTIRCDIANTPREPYRDKITGLIASPPCQDFSAAGKRQGRGGTTGWLIDQPLQWALDLQPEWVVCEQVPDAIDVWETHATAYRSHGYRTWVGVLNAANYGVPQTRRRAILLAHRERTPLPPAPTHSRDPQPTLFGAEQPWVTMAEALGWDDTTEVTHQLHTNRDQRPDGSRQTVDTTRPAPALTAKAGGQWMWDRLGATRITIAEALTLQSYPPDFTLAGGKGSQFRQVGNAVPPLLAQRILEAIA